MADHRPTSPHIQIYRWQYTMLLSILHRASGIVLSVGAPVLALWLLAIAAGPATYDRAQALLGTGVSMVLLFGWTLALFYHLLNGIRHLGWDLGLGFELPFAFASGLVVVCGAIFLTVLAWVVGLSFYGGV